MPVKIPSLKPLRKYILANSDIRIHRMGAVLFTRNGFIVSMACNMRGNGYVSEFSFHCEEMVLEKSSHFRKTWPEKDVYILVVRIRSGHHGHPTDYGLAKPCGGCFELCRKAGVKGIFYTTVDGIRSL